MLKYIVNYSSIYLRRKAIYETMQLIVLQSRPLVAKRFARVAYISKSPHICFVTKRFARLLT